MTLGVLLERLFKVKRPCVTCGATTRDVLVAEGNAWHFHCRTHLMDEFSRGFQASRFRMAVFEYDPLASKYTGEIYAYYPVSALRRFNWKEEDQRVLQTLLKKVDTAAICQQCGVDHCRVLYLSKEAAPWQKSARVFEEYEHSGELVCTRCALERLLPVLRNSPKNFVEGLYLPYQEEGMYMTTEL